MYIRLRFDKETSFVLQWWILKLNIISVSKSIAWIIQIGAISEAIHIVISIEKVQDIFEVGTDIHLSSTNPMVIFDYEIIP